MITVFKPQNSEKTVLVVIITVGRSVSSEIVWRSPTINGQLSHSNCKLCLWCLVRIDVGTLTVIIVIVNKCIVVYFCCVVEQNPFIFQTNLRLWSIRRIKISEWMKQNLCVSLSPAKIHLLQSVFSKDKVGNSWLQLTQAEAYRLRLRPG